MTGFQLGREHIEILRKIPRQQLGEQCDAKSGMSIVSIRNLSVTRSTPSNDDVSFRLESDSEDRGVTSSARGPKQQNTDSRRIFNLGERGSGLRTRGAVQDFYNLRKQCLEEGTLFQDPEFPADDSSIFSSETSHKKVKWLRPKEIVDDPRLFVEGVSRFDIQQGELGNCWLLAALANLTLKPSLFFQVVPRDQGFGENYAGIFHFRFWQYGRWVDVVIDDRLPTSSKQLIYLHSAQNNEFWSALVEKAYAKLHGSYEALDGGSTCEAMEDFTGGVSELLQLKENPLNIFKIIQKAFGRSSLICCSIKANLYFSEAKTPEGLVKGHAYSVTNVKLVNAPQTSSKIALIRLRNPWGNYVEWNGPWSDKSPEWEIISQEEREKLGLTIDYDGEFWMSFEDFLKCFDLIEMCNLNLDSLTEEISEKNKRKWNVSMFDGEWVKGVTAGGYTNKESFWNNPQYRITLKDPDEEDDEDKCTLIVALMQKNRRFQRKMGVKDLDIGFNIYHLEDPETLPKPLPNSFFKDETPVAHSPNFTNLREISCRFKLNPGVYCIVPSTYDPNEEGEFILRVYSESKNNMEKNDDIIAMGRIDARVKKISKEWLRFDEVKELFSNIAGIELEVDWRELQTFLKDTMSNETKGKFFSDDVCRSMVALMDVDRTGKLGYEEFNTLWTDVMHWKKVFKLYDLDASGSLNSFELRLALNSAGYRLNNSILNILVHRYGNKKGTLSFDDYVMCAVKLKTIINTFKEKDINNSNRAEFTIEEWVEKVLYS